ncbi:MAG: response regulator [Chryseolinea sp.]
MLNTKTVLLVEDDVDDQDFFIHVLDEIKNVQLFGVVRNGREALERLRKATILPSIIFMDVNMPVMNGIECLEEMAKDPSVNSIPVVMLSSSVHLRDRARFLGATAFIEKPNSSESLRHSLEQLIQRTLVTA